MQEIRLALVGAGHRGRQMFYTGSKFAEKIIPVAACDINSDLWYKSQRDQPPMAETFPDTVFYEDFHTMLAKEKIDVLLVETPATIHAEFCAEGLSRKSTCSLISPWSAIMMKLSCSGKQAKKAKPC